MPKTVEAAKFTADSFLPLHRAVPHFASTFQAAGPRHLNHRPVHCPCLPLSMILLPFRAPGARRPPTFSSNVSRCMSLAGSSSISQTCFGFPPSRILCESGRGRCGFAFEWTAPLDFIFLRSVFTRTLENCGPTAGWLKSSKLGPNKCRIWLG